MRGCVAGKGAVAFGNKSTFVKRIMKASVAVQQWMGLWVFPSFSFQFHISEFYGGKNILRRTGEFKNNVTST